MRRFTVTAAVSVVAAATVLSATPAQAHGGSRALGLENCAANACHFDVAPGTYDVRVVLGGDTAESTADGSKAIYLYNEKRDNTHTSVHGATVYARLVRDGLVARHPVPAGLVRVG